MRYSPCRLVALRRPILFMPLAPDAVAGQAPGGVISPDIQTLREAHRAGKVALQNSLLSPSLQARGVKGVLRQLAKHTDQTLRLVWRMAEMPSALTLVAVGGYGRGELFPASDVDVLVLLPESADPENDPLLRAQLERFIGLCWDAGLEIGS